LYVTASRNDPCSNALVEALSCGLPAVYYDGGGHSELVGFGGKGFASDDQLIPTLSEISEALDLYRGLPWPSSIQEVAKSYLAIANLGHDR
jgi:glycosyltransferase involved in cell wall biosynthesis